MAADNRGELYRRDDVRVLLRDILSLGEAKVTPKISVNVEYSPKEARISRIGFEKATSLMDQLSEGSVLQRHFHDKMIRCPHCNGFTIRLRLVCPRCGSHDLFKGEAVEHLRCGHVGLEETFRSGNELFCPKCRKELSQIGVDYKRAGVWFRCRGCSDYFGEPTLKFYCEGCRNLFQMSEAIFKDVYSYEMSEDVKAEVQANISYPDLIFARLGAVDGVHRVAEVKGRSGIPLTFDLLLKKGSKLTAVEFVQREASLDKILAIYAKSMEVDLHRTIVVLMSGIKKDVSLLAETYGITLIESDDPDIIATRIVTLLSNR
ncbi:MAG: hypothetical protein HYY22_11300 [Thaumarchaeota archaeon]|nr:hypothetical protein [Nitrososphaerota archaeon]